MTRLDIEVLEWFDPGIGDELERQTCGSLKITVETNGRPFCLSGVYDHAAKSAREFLRVPILELANFFITNWWRLRWEDRPANPNYDWKCSHRLKDIGGGNVWPPLEIYSSIDQISLAFEAKTDSEYSTLRFLTPGFEASIAIFEFERAVNRFLDQVQERISSTLPKEVEFSSLRAELAAERNDPAKSMLFKMQALAGFDPDETDSDFIRTAEQLQQRLGPRSALELISVLPSFRGNLSDLSKCVETMFQSTDIMDLSWNSPVPQVLDSSEEPWVLAVSSARELRDHFGWGELPLMNSQLEELTGIGPISTQPENRLELKGGLREGNQNHRIRVAGLPARSETRRFMLGRIIGAAQVMDLATERLLPVTRGKNRLQQFERAFAQELLCPWSVIDDCTNRYGLSEELVLDLAAEYEVSEQTVRTTLVNRKKAPRSFLETID
jgi:hypothetical protein